MQTLRSDWSLSVIRALESLLRLTFLPEPCSSQSAKSSSVFERAPSDRAENTNPLFFSSSPVSSVSGGDFNITWQLVPLNPKELTPMTACFGKASGLSAIKTGEDTKSIMRFGS